MRTHGGHWRSPVAPQLSLVSGTELHLLVLTCESILAPTLSSKVNCRNQGSCRNQGTMATILRVETLLVVGVQDMAAKNREYFGNPGYRINQQECVSRASSLTLNLSRSISHAVAIPELLGGRCCHRMFLCLVSVVATCRFPSAARVPALCARLYAVYSVHSVHQVALVGEDRCFRLVRLSAFCVIRFFWAF